MGWTSSLTTVATVTLIASTVAADLLTASASASNNSLLWGTYRPNLYFGTRPRVPESVMTGLMWFDASQFQGFQRKTPFSFINIENTKYFFFLVNMSIRHSTCL